MKEIQEISLNVTIGKLELKTPFVCASGTFGYGSEFKGIADFNSVGAFVTKTITLNPRTGNTPPRIIETECGLLNSIGLENPGVEIFIKEKLPQILKLNVPFLVSIAGDTEDEYRELVKRLDGVNGIDAFEVNLSCPNLEVKRLVSQSVPYTSKLVKTVRGLTDKTLVVKITGEVEDIEAVARAVRDSSADGISLVNTFFGMAIDIGCRKPFLGNIYGGYSGKGIKPLSLYRVWKVARSVDIPVIGGGGIISYQDAVEFFLAGASAVSLGTVNFIYPDVTKDMRIGLIQYMKDQHISDIRRLRMRDEK